MYQPVTGAQRKSFWQTKRSRIASAPFRLYYGTMAVISPLQGPVLPFLFTQCA